MSVSKPKNDYMIERITREYLRLLRERPLLTKALTSGSSAAIGNVLSQLLTQPPGKFSPRSVVAFGLTGFVFVGPAFHHFYAWLEHAVPKDEKNCGIKRLLIDRLLWAPPFLLAYLYIIALLEGNGSAVAAEKVKAVYWIALKMNWKVWTIFQYINVAYIPQQYRVLFGNALALGWNIYIASQQNK